MTFGVPAYVLAASLRGPTTGLRAFLAAAAAAVLAGLARGALAGDGAVRPRRLAYAAHVAGAVTAASLASSEIGPGVTAARALALAVLASSTIGLLRAAGVSLGLGREAFGRRERLVAAALGGALVVLAPAGAAPGLAGGALGTLALLGVGAAALGLARLAAFDRGLVARAHAIASLAGLSLAALVLALASGALAPADGAATALACALVLAARAARAPDPLVWLGRGRRLLALALVGGPLLAPVIFAADDPRAAPVAALVAALVALVAGRGAARFEPALRRGGGALLDAAVRAHQAIFADDAANAPAHALRALREATGLERTSPSLYLVHPARRFVVDAAGYVRELDGEAPPSVLVAAAGEPHGVLDVEVLRALEVRRPDLRPALAWLDGHDAWIVVALAAHGEPSGLLLVSRPASTEPVALDEALALRRLASALEEALAFRGASLRNLAREQALRARLADLELALARSEHARFVEGERHALAAQRLARPLAVAAYAPASRLATETLERLATADAPFALEVPRGVDASAYVARAHLASPRAQRPLVLVDGAASREHDEVRWRDAATSPLALADGGRLALLDGAALPADVQRLVARALAERRAPWDGAQPLDVALALSGPSAVTVLVDEGRLVPELAARLGDAPTVRVPTLAERSEDLLAILADRLGREGLRRHGRPLGIDRAAVARLVEHPFEGGEVELEAIVTRLVGRVAGDVVRERDVVALLDAPPVEEPLPPAKFPRLV